MRGAWLVVLVLLTPLSGCLSDEGQPAASPSTTPVATFGSIQGTVLDDELVPVEGVRVIVVEDQQETTTDSGGSFSFSEVSTGSLTLRAAHDRYRAVESRVEVEEGAVTGVELRLEILPSFAPRNHTEIFQGKFDCASEQLIITGDCMQVAPEAPGTDEQYEFVLPVGARWDSVFLELVWDRPATNQLDGMRLYLEHQNLSMEGHSVKIARTDGPASPLSLRVDRGAVHETADSYPDSQERAQIAPDGQDVLIRVFPRGQFYETTRLVCIPEGIPYARPGCLLGLGVGVDIKFTVYATVFYNDVMPDGFTAVPAAG